MAASLPAPDPCLDEALRRFSKLPARDLESFLRESELPIGGLREDQLGRIEVALRSVQVALAAAFDFLDRLDRSGCQHLFLYRLRTRRALSTSAIGRRLESLGLPAIDGEGRFICMEPGLQLAQVLSEPGGALLFKWVATRTPEQEAPERVVHFCRLDPDAGEAELRLRRLSRTGPGKRLLRAELSALRERLGEIVDLDELVPVPLEPVIRRLLTSRRVVVVNWAVAMASGGVVRGRGGASFAQAIGLKVARHVALTMAANWRLGPDLGVKLDARIDELEVSRRCSAEELAAVVRDVRRLGRRRLEMAELERLAVDHEEWRAALDRLDHQFKGLRRSEVEVGKLAQSGWLSEETAFAVAEELARQHPGRFSVHYSVRCPDSDRPVKAGGAPVTFASREAIPPELECRHAKAPKKRRHPTAGNVRQHLNLESAAVGKGLLPLTRSLVERLFSSETADNVMGTLAIFLFALLYVPLSWLTSLLFLELDERYDGPFLLVWGPFVLILVLLAGMVAKVLGPPIWDAAVAVVERLLGLHGTAAPAKAPAGGGTDPQADPADQGTSV